eukprot:gene9949-10969_t
MAQGKLILACFAVICVLSQGQPAYEHDEKICSKPGAEKSHPQCNWYYLAYAPRIFKQGDVEKVLVSTQNVDFNVDVVVSLWYGSKMLTKGMSVIKPGKLTEVPLTVPMSSSFAKSATLKIDGRAEVPAGTNGIPEDAIWTFSNTTDSIPIQKPSTQVFIQTDRPIYKPGETVRFRVLSLDDKLKAVPGVISKVAVLNPSQTLMRQWRNEKLISGIANFKMKLSVKPVLGEWRIKATVHGKQKVVYIKVDKYVLPKFQVKISPPPYVAVGQLKANAEICAKYSYGKDVNGLLKAKMCAHFPGSWNWRKRRYTKTKIICEDIVKKISGCHPIEADLLFFQLHKYTGYRTVKFTMEASVKEGATGITFNATKIDMRVEQKYVKLSFDGTPSIFKPGLPFQAWVSAKAPDGSPMPDDVMVDVSVRDDNYKTIYKKKMRIVRGKAKIDLPTVPFNAKKLDFRANYKRSRLPGSLVSEWSLSSRGYFTANAWYSPTHRYISITKDKRVYKPGSIAKFNVKYTTVADEKETRQVYYTLMSRGNVVLSGSTPVEFSAAKQRSRRSINLYEGKIRRRRLSEPTTPTIEMTTPEMTTQEVTTPEPTTQEVTTPEVTTPESTTQEVTTPEMTTPEMTTPEMTTPEMTTPEMTTPEMTKPEMTTTEIPIPETLPHREIFPDIFPRWTSEPVTRPPLPKKFSVGSFDLEIPITQEMTPKLRILVYYIKDRETVADSITVKTGNSFANKVSMEFSEKQVFPGTKVKLTLKASPGSNFAITAVDKSIHFLRESNDIKPGQVEQLIKNLDIGPGYINNNDRCFKGGRRGYWGYYSPTTFVDSQKAFNDNGMLFMSNMFVDTRPCNNEPIALPYYNVGFRGTRPGLPVPMTASAIKPLPTQVEELDGLGRTAAFFVQTTAAIPLALTQTAPTRGIISKKGLFFLEDAGMIVLSNLKIDTRPCDVFSGPFPIAYSKEENPEPGSGGGTGTPRGPGPGKF